MYVNQKGINTSVGLLQRCLQNQQQKRDKRVNTANLYISTEKQNNQLCGQLKTCCFMSHSATTGIKIKNKKKKHHPAQNVMGASPKPATMRTTCCHPQKKAIKPSFECMFSTALNYMFWQDFCSFLFKPSPLNQANCGQLSACSCRVLVQSIKSMTMGDSEVGDEPGVRQRSTAGKGLQRKYQKKNQKKKNAVKNTGLRVFKDNGVLRSSHVDKTHKQLSLHAH